MKPFKFEKDHYNHDWRYDTDTGKIFLYDLEHKKDIREITTHEILFEILKALRGNDN